jgi:hypothetical protein
MNVYNARIFKEQHKENNPEKWRVCGVCNEEKNIWQFSLLDKTKKTTTERKTIESTNPDGIVSKTSIFEFIQWREL